MELNLKAMNLSAPSYLDRMLWSQTLLHIHQQQAMKDLALDFPLPGQLHHRLVFFF